MLEFWPNTKAIAQGFFADFDEKLKTLETFKKPSWDYKKTFCNTFALSILIRWRDIAA